MISHFQDELAQGKVKIKEMGLPVGHPLKEGELISLDNLVEEVKLRITKKQEADQLAEQAHQLKLADGVEKGNNEAQASA